MAVCARIAAALDVPVEVIWPELTPHAAEE
jgi:hypothetical protein